jgi:hypothetical protein
MVTTPRPPREVSAMKPVALAVGFMVALLGLGSQCLVASPEPSKRDQPYALIAGTVWGPDDHPVYGVKVKIRRAKDKKAKWELYSDHMGEFAQRVPAGESDYILWADLKGFKSSDGQPVHLVQEVTVHVYNDEREDTGLHLAH